MGKNEGALLAVRFSALGDVAILLPELYAFARANPGRKIVMLTRPHPAALFINPPANLIVEGIDPRDYRGIGGMVRLWRGLRRRHGLTRLVDLHDVIRTRLLRLGAYMSLTPVTGYRKGRGARRRLTRRRRKRFAPLAPTAGRYRDALLRAGLRQPGEPEQFSSLFPQLPPLPAGVPYAEGERRIAIAPFARHKGKIYPPELMEQVVAHYSRQPSTRVYLFGFGPEEGAVTGEWSRRYPGVVDMAPLRLGLRGELELLARCSVMLSMDSANMHLASLVGLRTVAVWGATHPYAGFMARGQREADNVQTDLECRPCSVFGNRACHYGDYRCLRQITPQTIIDTIDEK